MYNIRRNFRLREMWWDAPELPADKRISRWKAERLGGDDVLKLPFRSSKSKGYLGRFNPYRKWKPYKGMGIDAGYICPMYSLNEIAYRYGLSQNTKIHWRKHILPSPKDVVVRRAKRAHHWSKIQLMVLDEILIYLERQGHLRLSKNYEDVIDLYLYGCDVMEKYYTEKYETSPFEKYDKFGVSFE